MATIDRLEQYYSMRRLQTNGIHRHWCEKRKRNRHPLGWLWTWDCMEQPWMRKTPLLLATVLIIASITGLRLLEDWNSFQARIGTPEYPNELVISRRPALDLFTPSWWRLDIRTGFLRSQLLTANQITKPIDVPEGLVNWAQLESKLGQQTRWTLWLATRLAPNKSPLDSISTSQFDVTDTHLLDFLGQIISSHESIENKRTALRILAMVAKNLDAENTRKVVDNLVRGIQAPDSELNQLAASQLPQLARSLSTASAEAALPELINALNGPDNRVSLAAAAALGNLSRALPTNEVDRLAGILRDRDSASNPELQCEVINALAQIGQNTSPAVTSKVTEEIRLNLANQNPTVRIAAATAFGAVNPHQTADSSRSAAGALRNALSDSDPFVKAAAAHSLSSLSQVMDVADIRDVIADLEPRLHDPDAIVKTAAAEALGKIATTSAATIVVDGLRNSLQDSDDNVRQAAVQALANVSTSPGADGSKEVVGDLRLLLDSENARLRQSVFYALGKIAATLTPSYIQTVTGDLIRAQKDDDTEIRHVAEYGLLYLTKTLGAASAQAIAQQLMEGLRNEDSNVQRVSAAGLANIAPLLSEATAEAGVDELRQLLLRNGDGKRAAAIALGKLAASQPATASTITNHLLEALENANSETQSAAIYALGNLAYTLDEKTASAVAQHMRRAQHSPSIEVQTAAAYTLGAVSRYFVDSTTSRSVVDALRDTLKSDDVAVKRAAAESLGEMAPNLDDGSVRAIVGELTKARLHKDKSVGDAAGHALGNIVAALRGDEALIVANDILNELNRTDLDTDGRSASLVEALAIAAGKTRNPELAGSALLFLDAQSQLTAATDSMERYGDVRRTLATAEWPQSTSTLLDWLTSYDSRYRVFAAHVLAQRQPLDQNTANRLQELRNDRQQRPWAKVAAMRCLLEMERERIARLQDTRKKFNPAVSGTLIAGLTATP